MLSNSHTLTDIKNAGTGQASALSFLNIDTVLRLSVCLLAFVLAWACPATAETIMDAYRLAHENDPKFLGAQAEFRASEQVLKQAKAAYLPTIKADFEALDTQQRILASNNPIFGAGTTDFPTKNHTLSLTQPIFRKDLIERIAQAKAAVRQAQFTILAAEQDLLQRLATAYLSVLAARDGLELSNAEKNSLRSQLELAEGRLKGGVGTITNFHDVSARYAVSQAREIEAENKLADAKQGLREITGKPIESFQTMRAEMEPVAPEPAVQQQWIDKAITDNLVLQARGEAVQVAWLEVERQRAGYYPSLNLVGTQNFNKSGSTLFGGGSTVETQVLTVRLTIPIFEGGLTTAVTAEAIERHQKALQDRELELRSVERQARAAYQSLVSGGSLVRALKQSVLSQQNAMQAKETGVRSGVYTLLMVLDAQRDLYTARRDYAQARYDYLLNTLRLKQSVGTLSELDLLNLQAALQ